MTEIIHRRSFATAGGLARTIPAWNTLEIKRDVYTDTRAFLEYWLVGQIEEKWHGHHRMCGYVQNMRLLELDNRLTLIDLINGKEDISNAKETIVQNELACERIHRNCRQLVETVDQYAVQTRPTTLDTDTSTDEILQIQSELARRSSENRNISTTELYEMLEQLEDKFGTSLIPHIAGLLAVNIPLIDPQASPTVRADTIACVDIEERFDLIFTTLMEHVQVDPILSDNSDEKYETRKQAFASIIDALQDNLSIHIALPDSGPLSFPLYVIPVQRAPSLQDILQEYRETIQASQDDGILPENPLIEEVASSLVGFFDSFGGLIVDTDDGRWYCPNSYVMEEEIGSDSDSTGLKLGQYYGEELFLSYVTTNLINQLLERSITNEVTGLPCPFCNIDHDLQQETCNTHKVRPDTAKPWAHPNQWADDIQELETILEDFVATETPGEDQLAAYRKRHEIAAKKSASDSS